MYYYAMSYNVLLPMCMLKLWRRKTGCCVIAIHLITCRLQLYGCCISTNLPSRCVKSISVSAGTKHRGLKPGQRKELMASAKEEAQNLQKGIKKAIKST